MTWRPTFHLPRRAAALIAGLLPVIAAGVGASAFWPPATAGYDEAAGRAELEKAARSLIPRPSTDTTPIDISVGGIRYRIPRNYIVTMEDWSGKDQGLITLRVNLPDMQPLTEKNIACFLVKPTDRPPGCEPFDFRVSASGGLSAERAFENMRPLFRSQIPSLTKDGFERYDVGPLDARTTYYRKTFNGRPVLYSCFTHGKSDPLPGICEPIADKTDTGSVIQFFFPPDELSRFVNADEDLRKLVNGFLLGASYRSVQGVGVVGELETTVVKRGARHNPPKHD